MYIVVGLFLPWSGILLSFAYKHTTLAFTVCTSEQSIQEFLTYKLLQLANVHHILTDYTR